MSKTTKIDVFRILGWLLVIAVGVLSLIRLPQTPSTFDGGDKWLHLMVYFSLSYWFFHAYHRRASQTVIGFIFMGTLLEWLQSLTGYRFMEWMDWVMNVAGVLIAWLFFYPFKVRIKTFICV